MQNFPTNTNTLNIEPGLAGLNEEQIEAARQQAQKQKIPLHQAIYQLGFITEEDFLKAVAKKTNTPYTEINPENIKPKTLKAISANIATHYNIIPVKITENTIHLATADPFHKSLKNEIEIVLNNSHNVRFVLADSDSIKKAIRKSYGLGAATVEQMTTDEIKQKQSEKKQDLLEESKARDASVINLVNQILADAITAGATDIHIEPYENDIKARYRIDGLLYDAGIPKTIKYFKEGIASRIKIISGLDIAEKRLPQDGRAQVNLKNQKFDLRISILPTRFGEAINIRILPQSKLISDLYALGMTSSTVRKLTQTIKKPHGIILLTGPTGSGKTTTLYTCIHLLKKNANTKILTIEDPVEYDMHGIVQMQVQPAIGFTFARALRSMLRHDPDIMLVGEIRDLETGQIAIRSALTGHLVFSTLHTNDAASAITRLLDMGIEPFLVASSLETILAQRLIRIICPNCKKPYQPEQETITAINAVTNNKNITFYHGTGCAKCRFTGYKGRTVITEMLTLSPEIRDMTIERKHSSDIDKIARKQGMKSLFHSGMEKVKNGITTPEEILRVTKAAIPEE